MALFVASSRTQPRLSMARKTSQDMAFPLSLGRRLSLELLRSCRPGSRPKSQRFSGRSLVNSQAKGSGQAVDGKGREIKSGPRR